MVHNGIEYGDMQMICEAYDLMQNILGLTPAEMGEIFNNGIKASSTPSLLKLPPTYLNKPILLLANHSSILYSIPQGKRALGKWTSVNALDMGTPAPTVAEAVFARCLSAVKDERVAAEKILKGPEAAAFNGDKAAMVEAIREALYASKICSYAQGFQLMAYAQEEYNWKLNFGEIAQIFRGGCIIRAAFLTKNYRGL